MYSPLKEINWAGMMSVFTEIKKKSLVFNVIAVYYALTYVFYFRRLDSFLKDVLIAPLYFLVPTGIGLLIFTFFGTHKKLLKSMTRMQLILSSTFLGFLLISLAYAELNNRDLLPGVFALAYPFFNLFSLVGFYHAREIFEINDTFRSVLKTVLLLFPLFLIAYYFHYIHFSPFPLRDIFQEIHFMKWALEFSKYHILSVANDSYFALLQVHSGLLNHFFKYNLINSQWILPAYLFFFNILCYYCFFSSFIKDRFMLNTTLGLVTIFVTLYFSNSNNGYLLGLTLVFFAVLVTRNKGRTKAVPVFLELLGLCALSIIFYLNRTQGYPETVLPYLISYLLLMLLISYFDYNRFLPLAFVVLLMLIAPPYHRAASLYIPLMLVLYGIYFACFQWRLMDVLQLKKTLLKKLVLYSIICPPFSIALGILIAKIWPFLSVCLEDFLNPICWAMVGQEISRNVGIVGTMAEWIRFAPPVIYVLFLFLVVKLFKERHTDSVRVYVESNLSYIIFCLVSVALFIVFYFSPLPNIHRLIAFPIFIIFAMSAFLFKFYYESYFKAGRYSRSLLLVPVSIIVYTLIARIVYNLPWKSPGIKSPYVAELFPITEICIAAMLLLLMALLLRKKASLAGIFVLIILVLGLVVDRFNIVTKLYGPAYGYVVPEPKIISHYTLLELRTAERLGRCVKSPRYLMLSDPYELGIFEARTGLNGFYSFANLGELMQERYTNDLKAIFRRVFPDINTHTQQVNNHKPEGTLAWYEGKDHPAGISKELDYGTRNPHMLLMLAERWLEPEDEPDCEIRNLCVLLMLAEFLEKNRGAYPEAEYTLCTKLRQPFETKSYDNNICWAKFYKDKIIWIISEKTIRWAYGNVGYYPMNTPFTRDYIERHILPYFDVILNSNNKVLVLKLK